MPITQDRLVKYAVWYVGRYRPCAHQLHVAMTRRVGRSPSDELPVDVGEWIDNIVARFVDNGSIDDEDYALSWARRYHRRGLAPRVIRLRLRAKGLREADIATAMAALFEMKDPDLRAACAYVRRRRFGPFRVDDQVRRDRERRDLSAMVRAGHRYEVSRRALTVDTPAALAVLEADAGVVP